MPRPGAGPWTNRASRPSRPTLRRDSPHAVSATFEQLGLSPETHGALRRARYATPTPIQAQAIPPALEGRDVIGCAATGTGKTAAYVIPLVERLKGRQGTHALVLGPTRELVLQIAEQVRFFAEPHALTHAVCIGGEDLGAQAEALRQRPTFVLATPGRLVDLIESNAAAFPRLEALVLDEADRMLDMGFAPQLNRILRALPGRRQTLLFSATLGPDVTRFAKEQLHRPVRVEVTPSGTPAERAEQRLYDVKPEEKQPLLLALLAEDDASAIIFTRTKQRADKVHKALQRAGYKASVLHADRTQAQRRQALDGFRAGQYRCLVATDIAARGLDVEDVGHVINFDVPHAPEDYVHRIGRTARAGAAGRASTFSTRQDAQTVIRMERIIGGRIPRTPVPRDSPAFQAEQERFLAAQRDPGPPQPGHGTSRKRR